MKSLEAFGDDKIFVKGKIRDILNISKKTVINIKKNNVKNLSFCFLFNK